MPTGLGRLSSHVADRFALRPPADARFLAGRQVEDPRLDDVGTPENALEALLPPDRPVVERVAEEGEVLQAAIAQVVEGKARDRLVVGLDPGDALDQAGGADVDRRHVHGRDDARHAIGFDARDDPVELPVAGEGFVDLVPAVLGQVEGPAVAGAGILVNPAQNAAGVAVRRLDDDRDVPLVHHRGPFPGRDADGFVTKRHRPDANTIRRVRAAAYRDCDTVSAEQVAEEARTAARQFVLRRRQRPPDGGGLGDLDGAGGEGFDDHRAIVFDLLERIANADPVLMAGAGNAAIVLAGVEMAEPALADQADRIRDALFLDIGVEGVDVNLVGGMADIVDQA